MTTDTITFAFELAALRQIREPQAVVIDARRWAQNVGITSADSGTAHAFSAEHLIRRDFHVAPTTSNFQHLFSRFTTERHVLVGRDPDRPDYLPQHHWEYFPLVDAASAAGWELDDKETTCFREVVSLLARLFRKLGREISVGEHLKSRNSRVLETFRPELSLEPSEIPSII